MEYLTDGDYATAAKNGIKRGTVYSRFNNLHWSIERTINTPTMERTAKTGSKYDKYFAICENYGIPKRVFNNRIYTGWNLDKACTVPIGKYVRRSKNDS